jgi:hypothetical protein
VYRERQQHILLLVSDACLKLLHSDSSKPVIQNYFLTACCAADNAYIPVGQFAWVNEGWIGVLPTAALWLAPLL